MNRPLLALAALALATGLVFLRSPTAVALQDSGSGKPPPQQQPPAAPPGKEGENPGRREGRREGRRHEEETPLSGQMEHFERAMRLLKRTLRGTTGELTAEQKEQCLKAVADAQQACVTAKLLVPKMAAHESDEERPAFVSDFRKGIAKLLIEWTNVEVALIDGDRDAALASYKKLEKMEDDGHSNFTDE
jgi:soluble cytochrome b562